LNGLERSDIFILRLSQRQADDCFQDDHVVWTACFSQCQTPSFQVCLCVDMMISQLLRDRLQHRIYQPTADSVVEPKCAPARVPSSAHMPKYLKPMRLQLSNKPNHASVPNLHAIWV
jgi:hypothetical protein